MLIGLFETKGEWKLLLIGEERLCDEPKECLVRRLVRVLLILYCCVVLRCKWSFTGNVSVVCLMGIDSNHKQYHPFMPGLWQFTQYRTMHMCWYGRTCISFGKSVFIGCNIFIINDKQNEVQYWIHLDQYTLIHAFIYAMIWMHSFLRSSYLCSNLLLFCLFFTQHVFIIFAC